MVLLQVEIKALCLNFIRFTVQDVKHIAMGCRLGINPSTDTKSLINTREAATVVPLFEPANFVEAIEYLKHRIIRRPLECF